MKVRTRFAPSPTGELHIGSVRTALYCWLFARKHQGDFILRIEDTDRERSTEHAIHVILDGMQWLGLHCDEGPFYQTQHFDRYHAVLQQWLQDGHAYRCYCSRERLETLREQQQQRKEKPRYDGHCRDLASDNMDAPFVVRFKNPQSGDVIVDDQILGKVVFQNSELDDLIIARTDGTPTYNFTVVVDDWDMGITHVIRGNDHLNNTPRQINMLIALGANLPLYAHLPMILGSDGKKLSKRHGAVSVLHYQEQGYLPHALLNYLVRLGWAHGDQEIFSEAEMIRLFDLDGLHKSPAAFDLEKLNWLNQHYLKTMDPVEVVPHLQWQCDLLGIDIQQGPALADVVVAQRERCKTLREMAEKSRYFFGDLPEYDAVEADKYLTAQSVPLLKQFHDKLMTITDWQPAVLHDCLKACVEAAGVGLGKLAQPVRFAVTGGTVSPSVDVTLALLGKEKTLARLERGIGRVGEGWDGLI